MSRIAVLAAALVLGAWGFRYVAQAALWNVVEQPDLKEQIDKAAPLPVESLGVAVRSTQPWSTNLAPNPDGKTYDILQWYIKAYRQKTCVYIVDLGTGQVKKQEFPETEGRVRPEASSWVLHWDGKLYGASPDWSKWSSGGGINIYVYDPAANEVKLLKQIPGLGGERHDLLLGPDGRLYGTGTYVGEGSHSRAGAYWLDPRTGETHNYGPVGPGHEPHIAYGYFMGVDEAHIYVASGKIPWYLVAVNIQTGEQKVLLKAPPGDYGQRMRIWAMYPGARAWANEGEPDDPGKHYWLYHGEAILKTGDNPPWQKKESPRDKAPPRPEVYGGQIDPDAQGAALLWYRAPEDAAKAPKTPAAGAKPEDLGWKSVRLEGIGIYPLSIHRLVALPDGRLFGTAQAYKGRFLYDPKTNTSQLLGRGGASPYPVIVHDGKVYWSGYSSAPIYCFDPGRPWTLEKGGPPTEPPPAETTPGSNPRRVGDVFLQTRVKKMFSAVVGADGKVYFGGIGQRDYSGGGLGWYDPKTGKTDGMWKPFSAYRIHWLTTALDGRLIVISTRTATDELNENRRPEEARIFVFDAQEGKIVRDFAPVPKAGKAGPVIEAAPGRLIGTTEDPEVQNGGLLYGVDIRTGEVLFRRKLPYALAFPWSEGTSQWDYQKGPDGFIWTSLKDALVRIDPKDASVHVVGKLSPLGKFAFVGRDLYLAGAEEMRVIRNAAAPPADR